MSVFYCGLDVKSLLHHPPSVDEMRPEACPCCEVASRPVGGPVRLHGHGLRDRRVIWVDGCDSLPRRAVLKLRRYRCTRCGAVITVLPRDLPRHRRHALGLICLALALWSDGELSAEKVREGLGLHKSFEPGWPQLRRWARGAEFVALGLTADTPHERAHQITQRVCGRAPPDKIHLSIAEMTFFGAAYVMRRAA